MLHLLTALPSKLVVMAICSALFWLGGFCWLPARRFIMPVIICGTSLFLSQWCLYNLFQLIVIAIFCLGYGEKSPLRHCFGDAWARFVWMFLSSLCLSLPLLLTNHLYWFIFPIYIGICGTLGITLRNINQIIGDLIFGASLASIILLIH